MSTPITTPAEQAKAQLDAIELRVYCDLKHGPIGEVLSMLADGCISRGKAAEAIAQIMVGRTPVLPGDHLSEFAEDENPGEVVKALREENTRLLQANRMARDIEAQREAQVKQLEEELDAWATSMDRI